MHRLWAWNIRHNLAASVSRSALSLRRRAGLNPWAAISLLAVGGWLVDSALMNLKMHGWVIAAYVTDYTHLWYGPPLLVVAVVLARRHRPDVAAWLSSVSSFRSISSALRPDVKQLAFELTRSQSRAAVMSYFLSHPTTLLLTHDLAALVGHERDEIQRQLDELERLGLVQQQRACELAFYGLTQDKRVRSGLAEVSNWQQSRQEQARRLAQAAGPSLLYDQDNGEREHNA